MELMKKILIAAAGKDRPGIVAAFTEVLFHRKCNLEDTSMTTLEDHFAMLLIVQSPACLGSEELESSLREVSDKFGLQVSIHSIDASDASSSQNVVPWIVSAVGPDKTGIVFHVAQLLASFEGSIRQLASRRLERDTQIFFSLSIEVELPQHLDSNLFARAISELAERESLEVHAEPLEEFNL